MTNDARPERMIILADFRQMPRSQPGLPPSLYGKPNEQLSAARRCASRVLLAVVRTMPVCSVSARPTSRRH